MAKNPGSNVTRFQFSKVVFNAAWCCAMSLSNIHSGFAATGVYPFNRNAPGEDSTASVFPEHSSISFVPLFSPRPPRCRRSIAEEYAIDSSFAEQQSYLASNEYTEDTVPHISRDVFSGEEEERFGVRYENGFNLVTDERYNAWLQSKDPEQLVANFQSAKAMACSDSQNASVSACLLGGQSVSFLSSFLKIPKPPSLQESAKPKCYARVLTSSENLQRLQEKE